MTTLTLIYASDAAGNFLDPETGKCWNIPEDREFFRETIKGKSVICGRKTFEQDWKGLKGAEWILVLNSKRLYCQRGMGLEIATQLRRDYGVIAANSVHSPTSALSYFSSNSHKKEEIFCVGGKQTIEAMAPFASRILATETANPNNFSPYPEWLPADIKMQIGKHKMIGESCWDSERMVVNGVWRRLEMTRSRRIEL